MSWFGSFAVSRLLSGHSRPARTNVKHAKGARCACSCNMQLQKKAKKKENSQSTAPSLPLHPISTFNKIMQPEEKQKVCRLFPFSSSLEDRRARILKTKKNKTEKCPQVIAKSAQITFFFSFTYIFFDVDPPLPTASFFNV